MKDLIMKTILNKIVFVSLFILLTVNALAQNSWGPEQTTYRRDLRKTGTNDVISNGLQPINTLLYIGNENSTYRRAVYQWEIPDTEIPDNSTINSVTLYFTYSKNEHTYELPVYFYSLSYDIVAPNQTQLNGMWSEMGTTDIGYLTGTNNVMNFVSNNSNNAFNIAIKNALPNNKFILGIKYQNENPNFNRTWFISSYSLTLRIEYTPPQQSVTLDQRLSNNSQVGKLRKWEGTDFTPYPYINPGTPFNFSINSVQTIQGDQAVYSNEKYQKWIRNTSDEPNILNHHTFTVQPNDFSFTSKFAPTYSSSVIKNNLEATGIESGTIGFKDPWFIDYQDASYGNNLRNRGMDLALWRNRPSPFYPNYTTVFNNGSDPSQSYKGVFLNQGADWQPPYYSVKAISPQDIPLTQTGKTHKFYFQDWTGSGVQFKYTTAQETPVVFTSGNAVVNANLKGHLLSDASLAFSGNGQRKLVRDSYGIYHAVYHTSTGIWYTRSATSDFNGTWTADIKIEGYAANPSIAIYDKDVKVAYEKVSLTMGIEIKLLEFNYTNPSLITKTVVDYCDGDLWGTIFPVIGVSDVEVFILYKKNSSTGLQYRGKY